jgi:hypothetical protein
VDGEARTLGSLRAFSSIFLLKLAPISRLRRHTLQSKLPAHFASAIGAALSTECAFNRAVSCQRRTLKSTLRPVRYTVALHSVAAATIHPGEVAGVGSCRLVNPWHRRVSMEVRYVSRVAS